jgi:hypothetical protein
VKRDNGKKQTVGSIIFGGTFAQREPRSVPVLTRAERPDFLAWLFSEESVARRPKDRKLARKAGLLGTHVSKQHCSYLHGSDLTERMYVAVQEFQRSGFTRRAACANVAKLPFPVLQSHLGMSRRGRPSAHPAGSKFERKTETIRSIVNSYLKNQHPWRSLLPERDLIVEQYVGEFLWLRKDGIVAGSRYVPDSGTRLVEAWKKRVAALQSRSTERR